MTIKFYDRDYFRSKTCIVSTELSTFFHSILNFTTILLYSIAFAHEKAAVQQHLQM